jgi:FixJ family two-component response regulator
MYVVAIIDNDASILEAMTVLIEVEGWKAKAYANGETFLKDFEQTGKVDCLILDPHLKGISGSDVAQALVEANIPIIGLTARPESLTTKRVIEGGVEAMLTKPVQHDLLVATIRRAIDSES